MATFKTETEMYNDVVAAVQTAIPTLTNFSEGSPERVLARLVAFGLSMAWKVLYLVYAGIWPATADLAALKNWYEVFGLVWNSPTERQARLQIIAKFRERSLGTAGWYEYTAITQFDGVTEAYCFAGRRGVNTIDLLVLYHGGDALPADVIAVQAYFDNAARKVAAIDVRVLTRSDVEEELLAAAEDTA